MEQEDINRMFLEIKEKARIKTLSTKETRKELDDFFDEVRDPLRSGERKFVDPKPDPDGGGGPGESGGSKTDRALFKETVQMTGLVGSYNNTHPEHPVKERGAQGTKIGGVGNTVGIIQGMKDSPGHLLEDQHVFVIRTPDGKQPFTNDELQQIIRELAIGIFVNDEIPFFSLHFNSDGTMYPVIAPEYDKGLIGKIMGMLDYIMKGFLNGGIFEEAYIREWLKNPTNESAQDMSHVVNIERYCKENIDPNLTYLSVQELMRAHGVKSNGNDGDDRDKLEAERMVDQLVIEIDESDPETFVNVPIGGDSYIHSTPLLFTIKFSFLAHTS